jgi:hypothetical protein
MKGGKPTRAERLAAALRENLKRRKARARAIADVPGLARARDATAAGEGTEKAASGRARATKPV